MEYRRVRVAGGCYFFTVVLADRSSDLLVRHVDILREAFRVVKDRHPFAIEAMVVLPDHLHCIWTLPVGDYDYSMRWMLIKRYFSFQLPKVENINFSRRRRRERGIWQRRFWEHCIRNEEDFCRHVEYVHYNPVKHGYVLRAEDWGYSSVHRAK